MYFLLNQKKGMRGTHPVLQMISSEALPAREQSLFIELTEVKDVN